MGRPKRNLPLVDKIAQAFAAVGKLPRRGKNKTRDYPFTYASDVLAAVRADLLSRGVLIHINEGKPEFVAVAQSNGGEQITECRLPITYTFMDATSELKPMTIHGIGRDVEDKAIYKAQTGAQKALLKRFGLMAEEDDDPEFDGVHDAHDVHDAAQEMRDAEAQKPPRPPKTVTIAQIHTFNAACQETGKSTDEVSGYLLTAHQVSKLADLGRGRPFTQALAWANQRPPSLSLTPKQDHASEATVPRTSVANEPYAVQGAGGSQRLELAPAGMQSRLPLPAPPSELKIGNQRIEIPARKDTYAL